MADRDYFESGVHVGERYTILEHISDGGMGSVYRAYDLAEGRHVALKVCMADEDDQRFAREVRAAGLISHPNVMPVLDARLDHEPPFFAMPMADTTLEALLPKPGIPPIRSELESLEIIDAVCSGLSAIHAAGVVHRDVKPLNILRVDDRWVVSDLGLAKIDPRDSTTLTKTSTRLGTAAYAAPEMFGGDGFRAATAKSDIFSLGKVLFELMTGLHPLHPKLSALSAGLAAIVRRCIETEPEDRYPSVDAFTSALRAYRAALHPRVTSGEMIERWIVSATAGDVMAPIASMFRMVEDSDEAIGLFDRIPKSVLGFMANVSQAELVDLVRAYGDALDKSVGGMSFAYAEKVADRMKGLVNAAHSAPLIEAAVRCMLLSSVRLWRFDALDTLAQVLVGISDPQVAEAAARALLAEPDDFRQFATRLDGRLPAALARARTQILAEASARS